VSSLVFEVVLFNTARPKHGVDTKFTHFVNEYDEVMTKHFTKRFIHHRGLRFIMLNVDSTLDLL